MGGLVQGDVDLAALIARIRMAFPDLSFDRARLNDFGEDHAVVELDDAWIFRFPRSPGAAAFAAGERRVLAALGEVSNLAVPRYDHVAPDGGFAGYRRIDGEELTEARSAALPPATQAQVLGEIGVFLAHLHALPLTLIEGQAAAAGSTGTARAADYVARRATYVRILPPALLAGADAFFETLARQPEAPPRLIHNDFTEDHILLAPSGDRLAGVIDFTDAGPGDPACDFTFLWAYGEDAPARALAAYGHPAEHAGLLRRSRQQFVRYRIDQLWWDAMGYRAYDTAKLLRELPDLLHALGRPGHADA